MFSGIETALYRYSTQYMKVKPNFVEKKKKKKKKK